MIGDLNKMFGHQNSVLGSINKVQGNENAL